MVDFSLDEPNVQWHENTSRIVESEIAWREGSLNTFISKTLC